MKHTSNNLWRDGAPSRLSPREIDVLGYLVEGKENQEIAQTLGLAPGTIKVYIAGILAELGLTNRTEAAVWAVKNGYRYSQTLVAAAAEVGRRLPQLTLKENEVLPLIADGHPNKVIAQILSKSVGTIKIQLGAITNKLGVSNRTQIAVLTTIARQSGSANVIGVLNTTFHIPYEPNSIMGITCANGSPVIYPLPVPPTHTVTECGTPELIGSPLREDIGQPRARLRRFVIRTAPEKPSR